MTNCEGSAARTGHRSLRGACLALTYCALMAIQTVSAAPPQNPEPCIGARFGADTARELAERFAPVLVFHPLEEYLPTSPLFPLESGGAIDPSDTDSRSLWSKLGTARSRRRQYEALSLGEKASLAAIYYRAYPARFRSRDTIVVEYWLYYVQNTYRVRGNLFPIWVDANHPNDLEHIHLVLRRAAEGCGLVRQELHVSSHAGTIPPNRYRFPGEDGHEHTQILVELGSHAMAPDIDEDGVYRPGADGDSGSKVIWGIRDRGITWSRYSSSYVSVRTSTTATVLDYAGNPGPDGNHLSYRLVSVEELVNAFDALSLTDDERRNVFEADGHWFSGVFGGDNGSSGRLLVPPERDTHTGSIGIESIAATERGFLAGGVFNLEEQGAFVGARYAYLHGIKYLPDAIVEADAVRSARRAYVSAQFLLSYPVDASIKLLGGRSFVTDIRLDGREWGWIAGVEIRLGRMRIYGGSRSWGAIVPYAKEFRVAYFF